MSIYVCIHVCIHVCVLCMYVHVRMYMFVLRTCLPFPTGDLVLHDLDGEHDPAKLGQEGGDDSYTRARQVFVLHNR